MEKRNSNTIFDIQNKEIYYLKLSKEIHPKSSSTRIPVLAATISPSITPLLSFTTTTSPPITTPLNITSPLATTYPPITTLSQVATPSQDKISFQTV